MLVAPPQVNAERAQGRAPRSQAGDGSPSVGRAWLLKQKGSVVLVLHVCV